MRGQRALVISVFLLVACGPSEDPDRPQANSQHDNGSDVGVNSDTDNQLEELRTELRQRLDNRGLEALEPAARPDEDQFKLGQMLFFDPVLSGTKDVNCASCHPMEGATSDPQPLSAGPLATVDEYGDRLPGPELAFTNRTSPDLFNRGHESLDTQFWDRRLEKLDDGRIVVYDRSSPEVPGEYLRVFEDELDSPLAAQAMFPVTSRDEMRGIYGYEDIQGGFNELAAMPDHDLEGMWRRLIDRLLEFEEYRDLFEAAYPHLSVDELMFSDAANALAAFMTGAFGVADSPFDQFLAGDDQALSAPQLRGADLFYGEAQCASCHGGALFTDEQSYNWAVPAMTRGPEPVDNMDLGVAHRSHGGRDAQFEFRTPPLRNVELTAPYMHSGVYRTLEDVIRHKMDPVGSLWSYNSRNLNPGFRNQLHTRAEEIQRIEDAVSPDIFVVPRLSAGEITDLVAFMEALTSPDARDLSDLEVESVPSGLTVPDPDDPH